MFPRTECELSVQSELPSTRIRFAFFNLYFPEFSPSAFPCLLRELYSIYFRAWKVSLLRQDGSRHQRENQWKHGGKRENASCKWLPYCCV
jgi:hypothetical protein